MYTDAIFVKSRLTVNSSNTSNDTSTCYSSDQQQKHNFEYIWSSFSDVCFGTYGAADKCWLINGDMEQAVR
jgi:hypothetical protein